MSDVLPGRPGPKLEAIYQAMTEEERTTFLPVLTGPSPADWLSDLLHSVGHEVSASTIRTYRRSLRRKEVSGV